MGGSRGEKMEIRTEVWIETFYPVVGELEKGGR